MQKDIYICSTVRHLLLSLLRSTYNNNESRIIVIIDQQNLEPLDYDLDSLPSHVKIEFIRRKEIIKEFYKQSGKLKHKFSLLTSFYGLSSVVSSSRLALNEIFDDLDFEDSELYLFNDRNRLARIFRLAFASYSLIEDGLANYIRKPISKYEVIRRRIKEGRKSLYKVVGDESQCSRIYLLNPERADQTISKKVLPIDFIEPEESSSFILSFFKCKSNKFEDSDVIVATQPISIDNYTKSGRDQLVYTKIRDYLIEKDISYSIKVHPRESSDRYEKIFDKNRFIDPKIPLEVFLLLSKNNPKIVSIYSTAGIGFESYCDRYTLIKDEEADHQSQVFKEWDKDETRILERIRGI